MVCERLLDVQKRSVSWLSRGTPRTLQCLSSLPISSHSHWPARTSTHGGSKMGEPKQQNPSQQNAGANRGNLNSYVTQAMLWLITAAWAGLFMTGLALADFVMATAYQNPLVGVHRDTLLRIGATSTKMMQDNGQWWRLLSSPFITAGAIQVSANISGLWTYGLFLASYLNAWKLGLVLFLSGAAGSCWSANMSTDFVTSSASAPVFGLTGGTVVLLIMYRGFYVNHAYSIIITAVMLAINLFIGATPYIDNTANLAGFVTGALASLGLLLLQRKPSKTQRQEYVLRVVCIVSLVVAVLIPITALLLLNLGTPLAGCCDQLVCTRSPLWSCSGARLSTLPSTGTVQSTFSSSTVM